MSIYGDTSDLRLEVEERPAPKDVFVSYSRSDTERLRPILTDLANAGVSLWIDTEAIEGATQWGAEIVKAINNAQAILVVGSAAAFKSPSVSREIYLALEKGKTILPIFLEATPVPPNVEYQLAGIQRIDMFPGDLEERTRAVLSALRRIGISFRHQQETTTPEFRSWVTPDQARRALKTGDGKDVKIALIDSGIEVSHPALKGIRLVDDIAVADDGDKLRVVQNDGTDLAGHGTAMADLIRGIAPLVEIGSFRVLGEKLDSRTVVIREGVRQAIDRGYHILSCGFVCGLAEHIFQYKEWVDEACLKGVHVVASCDNFDYKTPVWPAYFPTVLSVNAARTKEDLLYRAEEMVRFAANGVDVEAAWKGGVRKLVTGSSFAAARVAGYLANILSQCGSIPPVLANALLQRIATPWSEEKAGVITDF